MIHKPSISVIIPTYNRASSIKECLLSLLSQTLERYKYEVIVVDDGSTDNSYDVFKKADLPTNFFYTRQENGGPAMARNTGVEHAQGEIILFFDDDVLATPKLLSEHISTHNQYPNVVVLGYTPFAKSLPKNPIMEYHRNRWDRIFSDISQHSKDGLKIPYNYFMTLNLSVKKSDFVKLGPFNSDFSTPAFEDTELGLKFLQAGFSILFNRKAHAYHHPSLDVFSITKRQEKNGYSAGCYYLMNPGNKEMNKCMNVEYMVGNTPATYTKLQKIRRKMRLLLLNDISSICLLRIASKTPSFLSEFRNYLFGLLSWYYFSRGFHKALKGK
jgi:glycosyltransferase involved in cell wall biosynthesis